MSNPLTKYKIDFARLVAILNQIKRGTHDSCPTRRLPQTRQESDNDTWWLQYFQSQQTAHRDLAIEALNILNDNGGIPKPPDGEEVVRVLRVVEYVGPRSWVEETVARSVHGTRHIAPNKEIRAASIGTYPDVLHTSKKEGS